MGEPVGAIRSEFPIPGDDFAFVQCFHQIDAEPAGQVAIARSPGSQGRVAGAGRQGALRASVLPLSAPKASTASATSGPASLR